MDAAIRRCTKGIGIWGWASKDQDVAPDVFIADCGDIHAQEVLAATALPRHHFRELKIRFINMVNLFRMTTPRSFGPGL
jgi:xylulose-5-phosphate/fructose-6-phosphate phosphoketolase